MGQYIFGRGCCCLVGFIGFPDFVPRKLLPEFDGVCRVGKRPYDYIMEYYQPASYGQRVSNDVIRCKEGFGGA